MNQKHISYAALLLSIASLVYAAWVHYQAETMAKRREAEIVGRLAPAVRDIYIGFGVSEDKIPKSPQIFEELFQPFFEASREMVNPRKP